MRYKHFYGPNSTALRHKEDEALRLWISTVRRGVSALQYNRYPAAEIYLGAAYEIGILRLDCADNTIFDATHVVQPAARLAEGFLAQGNIAGAHSFLKETQHVLQTKAVTLSAAQERVLSEINQVLQQFQRDQNSTPVLDAAISDLPAPASVESRPPSRQPHRATALTAQRVSS
jgi:hypothetical protein